MRTLKTGIPLYLDNVGICTRRYQALQKHSFRNNNVIAETVSESQWS